MNLIIFILGAVLSQAFAKDPGTSEFLNKVWQYPCQLEVRQLEVLVNPFPYDCPCAIPEENRRQEIAKCSKSIKKKYQELERIHYQVGICASGLDNYLKWFPGYYPATIVSPKTDCPAMKPHAQPILAIVNFCRKYDSFNTALRTLRADQIKKILDRPSGWLEIGQSDYLRIRDYLTYFNDEMSIRMEELVRDKETITNQVLE